MAAAKPKTTTSKKSKQEYALVAPEYFNSVSLGMTFAKDPKDLLGRTTVLNMRDLTGKLNLQGTRIKFCVTDVKGSKANTIVAEQEVSPAVLKRLTRRRRSKIEVVQDVATKDGQKVRAKIDLFTLKRVTDAQKTALREKLVSEVVKAAKDKVYSDFIQEVAYGKLSADLTEPCRKIVPVRRIEIRKTELLTLPKFAHEEAKEAQ